MFHVEDDFDFDDDLLDTTTPVACETKLVHNDGSRNIQRIANLPTTYSNKNNVDKNSNPQKINNDLEFLKLWENKNKINFQSNLENSFSISIPSKSELITRHVKTVRQRKFPGPAGLLPQRQGNTSLVATEEFLEELNSENDETSSFQGKEILSQTSEKVFESGPWGAMIEDLGESGRSLISLMNLSSLRLKHTRGYKVPFLAVIINNIDCTLQDPTVVVKDVTDEMHGMLHRDVWEKFNMEMTPGSVLVLKNVGVISAGTTSRRHVLNITANNLTAIYSNRHEEHVQVRKISDLPTGDTSNMLHEWQRIVSTPTSTVKRKLVSSEELNKNIPQVINSPLSSLSSIFNVRRPLIKNNQTFTNSKSPSSSISEQQLKKRKNVASSSVNNVKYCNKKQTTLKPVNNRPFQDDSDTSLVDSLLDGIDTNSLFEEF